MVGVDHGPEEGTEIVVDVNGVWRGYGSECDDVKVEMETEGGVARGMPRGDWVPVPFGVQHI